jgi:hypothetical protein
MLLANAALHYAGYSVCAMTLAASETAGSNTMYLTNTMLTRKLTFLRTSWFLCFMLLIFHLRANNAVTVLHTTASFNSYT